MTRLSLKALANLSLKTMAPNLEQSLALNKLQTNISLPILKAYSRIRKLKVLFKMKQNQTNKKTKFLRKLKRKTSKSELMLILINLMRKTLEKNIL